ncbi:charged multivesicular body protein 6-A-like [Hyalella azteca]|uniref:Charged multivesicular body protein 6-A-like n=1 Tax=Hyalella azteca TaxID=294128 RepID=A0A8B7NZK7_HYAAZ|nr:charged multivesicular body protein 6-A-like [Hyalella azteca]
MGHLFSKKKRSSVTEQDRAVLQLKTTRDKIRQYQKRSEALLEKDRELAKKLLLAHKKERAKLLLRKKRFIEDQLQRTDGQLENIERMIQDLEFAQIEIKVVDSLRDGNEALKEVNKLLSIDDIERILEETKEGAEKQEEISALLCGFAAATGLTEDELDAELDALLQQDSSGDKIPELPSVPEEQLPDVPQEEPSAAAAKSRPQKSPQKRTAVEAS